MEEKSDAGKARLAEAAHVFLRRDLSILVKLAAVAGFTFVYLRFFGLN